MADLNKKRRMKYGGHRYQRISQRQAVLMYMFDAAIWIELRAHLRVGRFCPVLLQKNSAVHVVIFRFYVRVEDETP